jgi:uncharacterized protein (TIGR00725 family)
MTLKLDRAHNRLYDGRGRRFLPGQRAWAETGPEAPPAASAEPVSPQAAVAWLQRDSGQPLRAPVGVVGGRSASTGELDIAEALGAGLADLGLTVLCGGREGVMEAVCRGVASRGGLSVGLLPDDSWTAANPFVTLPLATGLGVARNAVVARAAVCLLAVGGGYGTTSEMAFALQFGRPVLALGNAPDLPGVVRLGSVEDALTALCERLLDLS